MLYNSGNKFTATLEDYKYQHKLGSGGFGEVTSVEYRGNTYAMKKFTDSSNPQDFIDELNVLKYLVSKYKPTAELKVAFKSASPDEKFYIVMDLLKGVPLSTLIEKAALDETQKRYLTKTLMHHLHELHKLGVIHGDLKPLNIMVTTNGNIKIIDFGGSIMNAKWNSYYMGKFLTPLYAPREILDYSRWSFESDVWSFAVTVVRNTNCTHT